MLKCTRCGNKERFHATAHVTQSWVVDGELSFIEEISSCDEVTHTPDKEDVITCAYCGTSNVDDEAVVGDSQLLQKIRAVLSSPEQQEEAAFKLGRDLGYLAVQTSEDGYDYTFYGNDRSQKDGGQLDNPDLSMEEAVEEILRGSEFVLFRPMPTLEAVDYDWLSEMDYERFLETKSQMSNSSGVF